MQVRKQQLELDMEQQTGSKLEKEYVKAVYCHPAYLTYMQSTSCKMLGWMKYKLESRLPGEISITSDMQMDTHPEGFLVAQLVKNLPAVRETWLPSLGWEDPLEKGKVTHSSILAWRTPWTVESMESQRVRHD